MNPFVRAACLLAMLLSPGLAPADEAPVSAARAVLQWSVAKERNMYGYLVYRADRAEGPFERVTPHVIRSRAGIDGTASYRHVDSGVTAGHTYYYRIESVSLNGIKTPLTGVIPKTIAGAPALDPDRSAD